MNARQLILGHSKKPERIVGSEVRLGCEGKALQIFESVEVVGMNAVLIELGAQSWNGVVSAAQRVAEPTRLQSGELVAGGRFDRIEQAFVRRFAKPHGNGL